MAAQRQSAALELGGQPVAVARLEPQPHRRAPPQVGQETVGREIRRQQRKDPLRHQVGVPERCGTPEHRSQRRRPGQVRGCRIRLRLRPRDAELRSQHAGLLQIRPLQVECGENQRVELDPADADLPRLKPGAPLFRQKFAEHSPAAQQRVNRFADELPVTRSELSVFAEKARQRPVGRTPPPEHRFQHGARRFAARLHLGTELFRIQISSHDRHSRLFCSDTDYIT